MKKITTRLFASVSFNITPKFPALLLGLSLAVPAARAAAHYQRLKSFGFNSAQSPRAPLVQGRDGALYGTTSSGGSGYGGTVFRLNTDGSGYEDLHHFSSTPRVGANPQAGLVEASDGTLYGTTSGGGSSGQGTVFKINKDASGHTVLYSFSVGDGEIPFAGLVEGRDGALYGTTPWGGSGTPLD